MSNSYEQWTQDPNTGQSHLWRWNEQTQNWDWVYSYPMSEDVQAAGAAPYQVDPQAAPQAVDQPVAEGNWQYSKSQEAPAQEVPEYEAPAQESSPEVTAVYEPASDLDATTSLEPTADVQDPNYQTPPASPDYYEQYQPGPTDAAAPSASADPTAAYTQVNPFTQPALNYPLAQPEPSVDPAAPGPGATAVPMYPAATGAPSGTAIAEKETGGKERIVKIVLAVLVLIALAVGGFFGYKYLFPSDGAKSEKSAATPQPEETTPAPETPTPTPTPTPTASATPSPTATPQGAQADGPLTNTHCTKHSKICFDYPANARIEEKNINNRGSEGVAASNDPNVTEMGTVIAADGTRLMQYMDNWLGSDACQGEVTVTSVLPIPLSNNAGRPAAVSSSVTKSGGKFTAELYATNDERLVNTSGYQAYDQCVYLLVQPNPDKSKVFTWFQVADAEQANSEGEALAALQSERYQRALNILKTLRNE